MNIKKIIKRLIFRILSFFLISFLLVFSVNETVKLRAKESSFTRHGIPVINSNIKTKERCTWICHDETEFCKKQHVNFVKSYLNYTDKPYFFIIQCMKSTGSYRLANIVALGFVIPFTIWCCFLYIIDTQTKIRKIKRQNNG